MDKKLKLRNNRDFRKVYDKGKSISNKYLVMFYIKNGLDYNRVGFSTTKKLGNAVIRNKVKRLIKESFRLNNDNLINGYDIVFLARIRANSASYEDMEKSIINLFKRSKLNK
ncbi:ribonuclease P protein component [Clostridium sp. D2Q-11]|uniref:Ribonuclease P protein component n=1 Tax=Anaeromonas frigoriresistens TaxID=2683708 RepID=A0A942V3L3_9FIRM|nr:ribonuclease P protein component [Anaeromonas frigoriresistens]MBS4539312.1 ribonuclease P protein component [Anaeromonas frigoriresistens]